MRTSGTLSTTQSIGDLRKLPAGVKERRGLVINLPFNSGIMPSSELKGGC